MACHHIFISFVFLNREVCEDRRYDFRVIVTTITELAKHYKDDNQFFEKVYGYCTVAYTVSTGIWKGSSSMKRDLCDIRKQFRLTDAREKGEVNFSDFLRKSLLSFDSQKTNGELVCPLAISKDGTNQSRCS